MVLTVTRLLVLGGVIACGSHQDSPSATKTSAPTVSANTVDPWASQPTDASTPDSHEPAGDAPASTDEYIYGSLLGYGFKVLDPKGMAKLSDPEAPAVVGYAAATCVIDVDFWSFSASNNLDFEAEAVRSFFKAHARTVAGCYASSLRDDSATPVKVSLVVAPSGQITRANARVRDAKLAACITDMTKKARFPKQTDERAVTVTYEIRFTDHGPNDCPG